MLQVKIIVSNVKKMKNYTNIIAVNIIIVVETRQGQE